MSTPDDLTAALDLYRAAHREILHPSTGEPVCDSDRHRWPCDAYRLLAALDAVLEPHAPVQLYDAADGCLHPEPAEDTAEHDDWAGDHPFGTTGERICILSPFGLACPMCSEMTYGDGPTTDDYVSASGCHVRAAITRALLGEEAPDEH